MSLRAISAELAAQGYLNENRRPYAAASIKSMLIRVPARVGVSVKSRPRKDRSVDGFCHSNQPYGDVSVDGSRCEYGAVKLVCVVGE